MKKFDYMPYLISVSAGFIIACAFLQVFKWLQLSEFGQGIMTGTMSSIFVRAILDYFDKEDKKSKSRTTR